MVVQCVNSSAGVTLYIGESIEASYFSMYVVLLPLRGMQQFLPLARFCCLANTYLQNFTGFARFLSPPKLS